MADTKDTDKLTPQEKVEQGVELTDADVSALEKPIEPDEKK